MKISFARYILILSFALLLSIPIISLLWRNNIVKAEESVLGDFDNIDEAQMKLLIAKPAVVQVTNIISGDVVLQSSAAAEYNLPALAGRTYKFVLGFSGSGFFINADGYLITNGHVAKPDDDSITMYAFAQLSKTIIKDIFRISYDAIGYSVTDSELDYLYQEHLNKTYNGDTWALTKAFIADYDAGRFKFNNIQKNNYIQTGVISGSEKIVKEYGKAATVVDSPYDGDFNSKDLALLKIEGSNFPIVEIGSFNNVQIGTEVYAIGYPGIVESATGIFTDVGSELEPSITKGIISAKKKLIDGTEAFQTDAGITHGNSGGPVINKEGKVIGVATWTFGDNPGGESFNFLISIDQVKNLLSKNNISPSSSVTTDKWKEALTAYSNKCYNTAKEKLTTVKNLYPDNVDVDDLITKSQAAIERGEDMCQIQTGIGVITIGVVICCAVVIIAVIVIIVLILIARRKKTAITQVVANTKESQPKAKIDKQS